MAENVVALVGVPLLIEDEPRFAWRGCAPTPLSRRASLTRALASPLPRRQPQAAGRHRAALPAARVAAARRRRARDAQAQRAAGVGADVQRHVRAGAIFRA